MMKHLVEEHEDKTKEEVEFSFEILASSRTAFSRQIRESIEIKEQIMMQI